MNAVNAQWGELVRGRDRRRHRQLWRHWGGGLIALLAAFGCSEQASTPSVETPSEGPDQVLWDFTTTEADSGRLSWIFRAEQALVFQATKRIESRGIRVDMYGEEGELNSTLTADSGLIDQRTGAMTATGSVHVVSAENYDLRTEVLHWDRERELFHTEAYVEVRQGENLYTGKGMECDRRLEHLRIAREPSGKIVQREELRP
jgi:LPS export ABC transporter protein LptC